MSVSPPSPDFSSEPDRSIRQRDIERRYYRQLGWSALSLREAAYWRHHRNAFPTQEMPFTPLKFAWGLIYAVVDVLTCPRRAIARARAWQRLWTVNRGSRGSIERVPGERRPTV